jgi:hypothetical protein
MHNYAIATPVYQETMQSAELMRLSITIHNNPSVDHVFFCPNDLNTKKLEKLFTNSQWLRFPNHHFDSIRTYSKLMLTSSFYKRFIDYEYLVISQLDSVVTRELTKDIFKNYDYVGAAWESSISAFSIGKRLFLNSGKYKFLPNRSFSVGNGGLSIRKVKSLIEITEKIQNPFFKFIGLGTNTDLNEDVIISYFLLKYGYSVPDRTAASRIFIEQYRQEPFDMWSVYGYHALEKLDHPLEEEIFERYELLGLFDYMKK